MVEDQNHVETVIEIPVVDGPRVGEQRLTYLQNLINDAKATVTNSDWGRSMQHSSIFHVAVIIS